MFQPEYALSNNDTLHDVPDITFCWNHLYKPFITCPRYIHLFFSTMDLLRAVEDILGNADTWPTYNICDLFVTEPKTFSVLYFAAFMYGNGVPIEKDIACFIALLKWKVITFLVL